MTQIPAGGRPLRDYMYALIAADIYDDNPILPILPGCHYVILHGTQYIPVLDTMLAIPHLMFNYAQLANGGKLYFPYLTPRHVGTGGVDADNPPMETDEPVKELTPEQQELVRDVLAVTERDHGDQPTITVMPDDHYIVIAETWLIDLLNDLLEDCELELRYQRLDNNGMLYFLFPRQ